MGSTLVDAGANPTLPVNTETGAGGTLIQITRPRRRGTADYDSGIVAIAATAPAVVTGATIYPEGGSVVNTLDEANLVTLTDTAGNVFFNERMAAKATQPIHLRPGSSLVGVKAGADKVGATLLIYGGQ